MSGQRVVYGTDIAPGPGACQIPQEATSGGAIYGPVGIDLPQFIDRQTPVMDSLLLILFNGCKKRCIVAFFFSFFLIVCHAFAHE